MFHKCYKTFLIL